MVSLNTDTGFPNEGASSCIPPLSVNIKYDLFIKLWKSITSNGSINFILSSFPNISFAISLTFGFKWTGYTAFTFENSSIIL